MTDYLSFVELALEWLVCILVNAFFVALFLMGLEPRTRARKTKEPEND